MRVIRTIEELSPENFCRPVATLGVFDGVHRGHQHLFGELSEWASSDTPEPAEKVVITFREHPLSVLGRIPPAALTSVDHRLLLLEREGIDTTVVLPFDKELASWSPEQFAQKVLSEGMGCERLLLGFNSGFGRDAAGTESYFADFPQLQLEVRTARPFLLDGVLEGGTDHLLDDPHLLVSTSRGRDPPDRKTSMRFLYRTQTAGRVGRPNNSQRLSGVR